MEELLILLIFLIIVLLTKKSNYDSNLLASVIDLRPRLLQIGKDININDTSTWTSTVLVQGTSGDNSLGWGELNRKCWDNNYKGFRKILQVGGGGKVWFFVSAMPTIDQMTRTCTVIGYVSGYAIPDVLIVSKSDVSPSLENQCVYTKTTACVGGYYQDTYAITTLGTGRYSTCKTLSGVTIPSTATSTPWAAPVSSTSCTSGCPAGQYLAGGTTCTNCPAGQYQATNNYNGNSCPSCAVGQYSTGGAASCSTCTNAPSTNYYTSVGTTSNCPNTICAIGQSPNLTKTGCTACAALSGTNRYCGSGSCTPTSIPASNYWMTTSSSGCGSASCPTSTNTTRYTLSQGTTSSAGSCTSCSISSSQYWTDTGCGSSSCPTSTNTTRYTLSQGTASSAGSCTSCSISSSQYWTDTGCGSSSCPSPSTTTTYTLSQGTASSPGSCTSSCKTNYTKLIGGSCSATTVPATVGTCLYGNWSTTGCSALNSVVSSSNPGARTCNYDAYTVGCPTPTSSLTFRFTCPTGYSDPNGLYYGGASPYPSEASCAKTVPDTPIHHNAVAAYTIQGYQACDLMEAGFCVSPGNWVPPQYVPAVAAWDESTTKWEYTPPTITICQQNYKSAAITNASVPPSGTHCVWNTRTTTRIDCPAGYVPQNATGDCKRNTTPDSVTSLTCPPGYSPDLANNRCT